jgi:hypothetical protein
MKRSVLQPTSFEIRRSRPDGRLRHSVISIAREVDHVAARPPSEAVTAPAWPVWASSGDPVHGGLAIANVAYHSSASRRSRQQQVAL